MQIRPGLIRKIDARWSKRFGYDATRLYRSLETIEQQIDLELPHGLPGAILKLPEFTTRKSAAEDGLPCRSCFLDLCSHSRSIRK